MKRLFIILLSAVCLISCSDTDKTTDEVEYVTISLTPQIDYSIEPLTRAEITDKDYIFVQIAMLDGSNMYSGWQSELNGFFTKGHEIKFKLVRGAHYLIKAIIVKDMVGKIDAFQFFDPNKVNTFNDDALIVLDGLIPDFYINGQHVGSSFPLDNYVGGIFIKAEEDVDINLNMIHNVYGITPKLTGDTSGELYVASVMNRIIINDYDFVKVQNGETLKFMYKGDIFDTIDWLTTGDTITCEGASAPMDVYFKYITADGEVYNLSVITIPEVERGKNIIININTDDIIPAEGTVDFNILGDGDLEDVQYN